MATKRYALSKTITLIESTREEHREDGDKIMHELLQRTKDRKNKALRIGICGAPGAGKSSLIEKLGLYIVCEQKLKLAVLAIDPSSKRTGGSILGDKTRMELLSNEDNAFVRPSPTKGILGGVALNTSEVQLLCEHAGYDIILVETVGVGQSEIEIENVADFVIFVVPPGSGDSLQGSKKGVMEIADLVVVNKYDEDYKQVCRRLKRQIESALTLSMSKHMVRAERDQASDEESLPEVSWFCPVELVSAKENFNIEGIWTQAMKFKEAMGSEYILKRRQKQLKKGMWNYLSEAVLRKMKSRNPSVNPYFKLVREMEL